MTIPKRAIRGAQDIRTRTGPVTGHFVAHEAYMRITCLEMERARRENERESAMCRVRNVDARFKEIDAERAALLGALDEQNRAGSARATKETHSEDGFKIRY